MRAMEEVGFFMGLGVVLVLISAAVAGRVTAVPSLASLEARRPATAVVPTDSDKTQVIG